jgi:hypothetical protein
MINTALGQLRFNNVLVVLSTFLILLFNRCTLQIEHFPKVKSVSVLLCHSTTERSNLLNVVTITGKPIPFRHAAIRIRIMGTGLHFK